MDIYFRLFITKNAENSACQKDHVTAIVDFVTIGLAVVLCWDMVNITLVRSPLVNSHIFTDQLDPWSFPSLLNPSQLDPRYMFVKTLK